MSCPLEYHRDVNFYLNRRSQRLFRATLALLGLFSFTIFSAANSPAQNSSANSSGSAHSSVSAPSSASHYTAPATYAPPAASSARSSTTTVSTHSTTTRHSSNSNPPHGNGSSYRAYIPYLYAVPMPYAVDGSTPDAPVDDASDDADYQGGPTVFDRRGSGADSYVPPASGDPAQNAAADDAPGAQSISAVEPPEASTTLVFKDGHQLEVDNYAIVNQTLFDLTPGHARKVPLADLDLAATSKQNDERGVTFQLPPSSQAN